MKNLSARVRLTSGLAIILLMLSLGLIFDAPSAKAYTCSDNSHYDENCYGAVYWHIDSGFPYLSSRGGSSQIQVVPLNNTIPLLIDNELWMKDVSSGAGCDAYPHCWIDGGYTHANWCFSDVGCQTDYYFSAAINPNFYPNNLFRFDFDGNVTTYDISSSARCGNGGFCYSVEIKLQAVNDKHQEVYYVTHNLPRLILGCGSSCGNPSITLYQFTGPWQPALSYQEIGLRVAGTSGASAPFAVFNQNIYYDWAGNPHYENTNPSVIQTIPPYAGWLYYPSQSSTGGTFYTQCGPPNVSNNC